MTKEPEFYICDTCDTMKNYSRARPTIVKSEQDTDEYICPDCWEKEFGD